MEKKRWRVLGKSVHVLILLLMEYGHGGQPGTVSEVPSDVS